MGRLFCSQRPFQCQSWACQGTKCQPFISQERKLQPGNGPPCRAPVATTPVLRPAHSPQKRELEYPQVSWAHSRHPPSPPPDVSQRQPPRLLDLTHASSRLWPRTHLGVPSAASGAHSSLCSAARSPALGRMLTPPLFSGLCWAPGWRLPISFSLSPSYLRKLWRAVLEDFSFWWTCYLPASPLSRRHQEKGCP